MPAGACRCMFWARALISAANLRTTATLLLPPLLGLAVHPKRSYTAVALCRSSIKSSGLAAQRCRAWLCSKYLYLLHKAKVPQGNLHRSLPAFLVVS